MLDLLIAYDVEGGSDNARRIQLALDSIKDVDGAIKVIDHDDGTTETDASEIVMPAVILLNFLLETEAAGVKFTREGAIAEMRAYLDGELD